MVLRTIKLRRYVGGACLAAVASFAGPARGQDVELSPAFEPPPIQNTLLDFVTGLPVAYKTKVLFTNKLLRPPFAEQPVDTPKGLAAKIKANQLDAKNRIKAVKFLGTVDCQDYPESQEILLKTLREDKVETVRLAAAKAIGEQLSHGTDPKPNRRERRMRDNCLGCCKPEILNALVEQACGRDDYGCFLEPSQRVREAILEALENCPCNWCPPDYASFQPTPVEPPPGPAGESLIPPAPAETEGETQPPADATVPPPEGGEPEKLKKEQPPAAGDVEASAFPMLTPPPAANDEPVQEAELEVIPPRADASGSDAAADVAASAETPAFDELTLVRASEWAPSRDADPDAAEDAELCIVSLAEGSPALGQAKYASVFRGTEYRFSSREAKAQFDACPLKYVPIYGGIDRVEFIRSGEKVIGNILVRHRSRSYLFVSEANCEAFLADPASYE